MLKSIIDKVFNRNKRQDGKCASSLSPEILDATQYGIHADALNFAAEKVVKRLQDKGYEAFVVGGAVRDLLLKKEPKDFDIATNAKPEEVHKLFRRSRIIGRRFKIVHVMIGPEVIEVTTFRGGVVDQQNEHGRIMKDNSFGSQAEDAMRRDFTCNALYYNPEDETIIDYHHGVRDIQCKKLVIIGDPVERYKEDAVRILRAVRLSAKLGFELDSKTARPIVKLADLIKQEPAARLFDELLKLLLCGHAQLCLQKLEAFGISAEVFPLLKTVLRKDKKSTFAEIAIRNTDERIQVNKNISVGFLMATLLWQPVYECWQLFMQEGQKKVPALIAAMAEVQKSLNQGFSIPRRFSITMREIWLMQPQFEARIGARPFKLLTQPRFRAAYDFLLIRAEVGEIEPELSDWWTQFQAVSDAERREMISKISQAIPNKRKRRYSRPRLKQENCKK